MQVDLEELLKNVQKPARYTGGEWNSIIKPKVDVDIVLSYPDTYEVGMSNLALQILYEIINGVDNFRAERVFAPWPDMENNLRRRRRPLFSLESRKPVRDFNLFGFTLQYEMTYTNILNLIDLAGLPIHAVNRDEGHPLIVGGGPGAFNPEPLADFFDFFVIGDGEEIILEIMSVIGAARRKKLLKRDTLSALADIEGVYLPVRSRRSAPAVKKRIIPDLNTFNSPKRPIVPSTEVIHDRAVVEIMRGCTRGCRFCQAGIVYRPFRERSSEALKENIAELLSCTGYNEVSLASLSSTDYSKIQPLINDLMSDLSPKKIALALPSMRVDRFSINLASQIRRVRKTGLTLAPEAGSQRLRRVINKNLTEEAIVSAALAAYQSGWRRLKLYFMLGLPTETDDDVRAIVDLSYKILRAARANLNKAKYNSLKLVVSVSNFVPKPHTPFQWRPMIGLSEIKRRQDILKRELRDRRLKFKWHQAELSLVEGALARGGRQTAPLIERAWRLGAVFDGWDEYFNFDYWQQAFADFGLDLEAAATRGYDLDAPLPWSHIDSGVDISWLASEYKKALKEEETADCRQGSCSLCGVCRRPGISNRRAVK